MPEHAFESGSAVESWRLRPELMKGHHEPVGFRHLRPLECGLCRCALLRAKIGPNHAAHLDGRISGDVNFGFVAAFRRLVHHVHAVAFNVEFPATRSPTGLEPSIGASRFRGASRVRFLSLLHFPHDLTSVFLDQ